MTPEENIGTSAEDEDINTTVPQSKPDVWQMPEPVFRKTSGKLPSGYAQAIEFETIERASRPDNDSESFEPQILPATQPESRPKSPVLKIVVVVLAIAAMIAFITVFLTILYFWFLR